MTLDIREDCLNKPHFLFCDPSRWTLLLKEFTWLIFSGSHQISHCQLVPRAFAMLLTDRKKEFYLLFHILRISCKSTDINCQLWNQAIHFLRPEHIAFQLRERPVKFGRWNIHVRSSCVSTSSWRSSSAWRIDKCSPFSSPPSGAISRRIWADSFASRSWLVIKYVFSDAFIWYFSSLYSCHFNFHIPAWFLFCRSVIMPADCSFQSTSQCEYFPSFIYPHDILLTIISYYVINVLVCTLKIFLTLMLKKWIFLPAIFSLFPN